MGRDSVSGELVSPRSKHSTAVDLTHMSYLFFLYRSSTFVNYIILMLDNLDNQ